MVVRGKKNPTPLDTYFHGLKSLSTNQFLELSHLSQGRDLSLHHPLGLGLGLPRVPVFMWGGCPRGPSLADFWRKPGRSNVRGTRRGRMGRERVAGSLNLRLDNSALVGQSSLLQRRTPARRKGTRFCVPGSWLLSAIIFPPCEPPAALRQALRHFSRSVQNRSPKESISDVGLK